LLALVFDMPGVSSAVALCEGAWGNILNFTAAKAQPEPLMANQEIE
jgi:hypothetical protein